MSNEIKGSELFEDGFLKKTIKETKEAIEVMDTLDKKLISISKNSQLDKGAFSAKKIQNVTNAYQKTTEAREKSILVDKEKIKLTKQLTELEDEQVKGKLRAQRANKEQRDALKAQIVLNDKLAGTEEKILAQNRLLRLERKKLIKGTKDYDKELKRINTTLDANNAKTRAGADLDKKRLMNIGNYKTALGGLNKVLGALGISFALSQIGGFIKDLNLLANEAKGVEFAFQNIGEKGVQAFNAVKKSTRGLLSDIDIRRSIIEFDNFNLSLADADTLFEFVALRATQTGKSFEGLRDSLVEGLSKESLRRLDNLGISMIDMRKYMDEFGVSVNEAFTALAKAEIERAGNVLDEAASAQQRFNAQWENFKLLFAKFIQPALNYILDFASGFISFLEEAGQSISQLFGETKEAVKSLTDEQAILNDVTEDSNDKIKQESDNLRKLIDDLKNTTAGTKEREEALDEMNSKYGTTLENLEDETKFVNQLEIAYSNLVMQLSRKIRFDVARSKLTELITKQIQAEKDLVFAQQQVALADQRQPIQDFNNSDFIRLEDTELKRAENNIESIKNQILELERTFKGVTPLEEILNPEVNGDTDNKKGSSKSGLTQLQKDIIANEEENRRIREEKIKASNLRIDRIEQEAYDKELQRQNDLAENEAENQRIKEENAKKELERLKKQKEESIKLAKDVSNFIAQETDERIRLRQTEIQQGQDKINALIATGTANSAEAIAAEEKAIARKSVEIEELERKKKNLLLSVVALERASQLIGQGDSQPLVNSGKGIEKLLSGLPKFFKGTDKTVGDELNKVTNTGKDDYLALVDKNEMIFTGQKVDSMAKVGLNSTDQITASAIAYQTQGTANRAMRSSVQSAMTDARIVSKLESLEKAIIDKPVANTTMLDPAFQRAFLLSKGKIETLNYDNTPQI